MATYNKFNQFVENVANGVHDLATDSLKLALTATAHTPTSSNAVLADLTEIAYTNCSSRAITTTSCTQTSGTLKLIIADLVLSASGGAIAAFQYVVLYDDTPTSPSKPLIGWWDYGSALTLNSGESLTVDFDNVAGVLQIA